MSWEQDQLAAVETLLFRSSLVKIGHFDCDADHPCFAVSEGLDNDVFVLPKNPIWLRRDDGEFRFVEPGAILLHQAGSTLQRRCVSQHGDCAFWFGIHPALFRDALQRHNLSSDDIAGAQVAELKLHHRIAMLLKQLQAKLLDRLGVEEAVVNLFHEVCERRALHVAEARASRTGTAQRQRRSIDRARAYLDAHLFEAVGLEKVAAHSGMSLYHLCRVFRQETGLSMHAYRTRLRLGRVVDRLMDDRGSDLTDLALDTGFNSHSHLSRVFRSQMGLPPSAIRSQAAML